VISRGFPRKLSQRLWKPPAWDWVLLSIVYDNEEVDMRDTRQKRVERRDHLKVGVEKRRYEELREIKPSKQAPRMS
jgi:hypothetical protein